MSENQPSLADTEKRSAALAATNLVSSGMTVGLGTGSTVAFLLPALAERDLHLTCVATSVSTEIAARQLGLDVRPFDHISHLDIAIDGSDQVSPEFWLIKGGGGAHTREKIVASAAERFIVMVSSEKLVPALRAPVPLELLGFGLDATLAELSQLGECRLRGVPATPDGGVIVDYYGPVSDPATLAAALEAVPGVVGHGLFAPMLVSDVLVGRGNDVEHLVHRR